MVGELRFTKADRAPIGIHKLCAAEKADVHGVKIRVHEVPEFYPGEIFEMDSVGCRLRRCVSRRNSDGGFGHRAVTVAQLDFEREAFAGRFRMQKKTFDIEAGVRA